MCSYLYIFLWTNTQNFACTPIKLELISNDQYIDFRCIAIYLFTLHHDCIYKNSYFAKNLLVDPFLVTWALVFNAVNYIVLAKLKFFRLLFFGKKCWSVFLPLCCKNSDKCPQVYLSDWCHWHVKVMHVPSTQKFGKVVNKSESQSKSYISQMIHLNCGNK